MSQPSDLPLPPLDLSEEEAGEQFERLQRKLKPLWESIRQLSNREQTIVVVPSQSSDFECHGAEMQGYEERYLFLLLLLRQPRARMVYVTSQTVLPNTIDYYLGMMPGVIASHARKRFFNVATEDRSPRPLSRKLLERPKLIEDIRSLIPDPDHAHLVTYNVTEMERDLALRLGIPLYGPDPKFFPLGSKTGCRRLFADEKVCHPLGREDLHSIDEVAAALVDMRRERPSMSQVMVKLNDSISGEGNAVAVLDGLPEPGDGKEIEAVTQRVRDMQFESTSVTFDGYETTLKEMGGIVEERIVGEEIRSPSAQLRVTPLGEVELLSTHDQLLGGPTGQLYLGCRFPADSAYAAAISRESRKVGERLAKEGVLGRFAIDFVVVRKEDGSWDVYAIEINLRKGGTTHPFLTLQFLTDGTYDDENAVFTTPNGHAKYFLASDHIESPLYRVLTPDDVFDIAIRHKLHFSESRHSGVVFHMLATIAENGRIGVTAVGNSPEEAEELYNRVQQVLEQEATEALAVRDLPGQ